MAFVHFFNWFDFCQCCFNFRCLHSTKNEELNLNNKDFIYTFLKISSVFFAILATFVATHLALFGYCQCCCFLNFSLPPFRSNWEAKLETKDTICNFLNFLLFFCHYGYFWAAFGILWLLLAYLSCLACRDYQQCCFNFCYLHSAQNEKPGLNNRYFNYTSLKKTCTFLFQLQNGWLGQVSLFELMK